MVGDTGGLGELVEHGVTGYKVQPGNPSALAKTLVCLIGDGKKREELASNGRELVKRDYRWEDIARTTLSLYKDVAELTQGFHGSSQPVPRVGLQAQVPGIAFNRRPEAAKPQKAGTVPSNPVL